MNLKHIVLLLLFTSYLSFSQHFEFELDYKATYLIPKSNDTINIMVGENGKYLYTDSEKVAEGLRSSFRRFGSLDSKLESSAQLLLNMSTNFMLMKMKMGENTVWGHVNLTTFMSRGAKNSSELKVRLVAKPTNEFVTVNNKEFRLYNVAPTNKPDDIVAMAFDESYNLDYNAYFNKLISAAAGDVIEVDIPNGVLVYARKEQELLRLITLKKEKRKGKLNLDLTFE